MAPLAGKAPAVNSNKPPSTLLQQEPELWNYCWPAGAAIEQAEGRRQRHERVEAPAQALPIIILPGFGNCTKDYLEPPGQDAEAGLAAALEVGPQALSHA